MLKIKAFALKSLLAFSAFLTAWQVKAVNAQMVYMPAPGPWPKPGPVGPTPLPDSGNTIATWSVVAVIFLLALIGLIVVIKWLVSLIISLLKRR
jgi:hypothetical protein